MTAEIENRLSAVDYVVFGGLLAVSASIGVIHGCFGKKMENTKDFLLAGKSMTTFPVAMSLIASFMSAISLLGTPSEVYQNGFIYWLIGGSYILVTPAVIFLYLPVFWDLQVTSAYEYLELRFNRGVRLLGSFAFILQMSMYMAIVVYAPALAIQQVTGLNVYLSVCLISIVCVFYTTLGGMKSVLWTDALQVVVMYASLLFIVIKGTLDLGGFEAVWEHATPSNRTNLFDWDFDPRARHTFWSLIIGGYFTWITIYGVNQAQVQRYLCVKEKRMAFQALLVNLIGLLILMNTCAFAGLIIYMKYDCDPQSIGRVSKHDQLFPLFVMDTLGEYPGIPGLFIAGIFSGALSTVSSGINSLAAITLEDFVKGLCFPCICEKYATWTSKGLSLFYGLLTFGLVFVAEQMGDVLSAALGLFGMIGGPLLGVFTLGMFFPWANSLGAGIGTVVGLIFTIWIGFGKEIYKSEIVADYKLPVKICDNETMFNDTSLYSDISSLSDISFNATLDASHSSDEASTVFLELYKISYMWYSAVGCWTVIVVALVISLFTGLQNTKKLNPKLLSPFFHLYKRCIPRGHLIGSEYDPSEELTLKQCKLSERSLGGMGELNAGYPSKVSMGSAMGDDNPPPYCLDEGTKL